MKRWWRAARQTKLAPVKPPCSVIRMSMSFAERFAFIRSSENVASSVGRHFRGLQVEIGVDREHPRLPLLQNRGEDYRVSPISYNAHQGCV